MALEEIIVLVVFFAVVLPLGRALVRRVESGGRRPERSGGTDPVTGPVPTAELESLRRQLAELSDRVERLGEEQDFLVRLLEERPSLMAPKPEGKRSSGP